MTKEKKDILVLLVDDEPNILELMEEEFDCYGYQTVTANCGNDACEVLKTQKVDIVVSDYKMPNGNGMTVLEHTMSMDEVGRPVFFFISGQADISIQEILDAGARKFFLKPFSLDYLIEEIESEINS